MGGLSFAVPWLLAAAAALPLAYFLLRLSPPPPVRVKLPSLKLLPLEDTSPPQAARPPWWLLALRLGILVLLLTGLSGPSWQPVPDTAPPERLTIVIDNGWASAARWPEMVETARKRIEAYEAAKTRIAIISTADRRDTSPVPRFVDTKTALNALGALEVEPWGLDREAAAARIPDRGDALWISDGYEDEGAAALRRALAGAEVSPFPAPGPVFLAAGRTGDGWAAQLVRPPGGQKQARMQARNASGRLVDETEIYFDRQITGTRLTLAPRERAETARLTVGAGPAALYLADLGGLRPRVAVIRGDEGAAPLQSGDFYVRRALEPYAEVAAVTFADAAQDPANFFVLTDVAATPNAAETLLSRAESGAVVVSFAGPRIAENGTALSPTGLRAGARAFGGIMSWQEPQRISSFADERPLEGLPTLDEARVVRQVLGRSSDPDVEIWATLEDGTPLVSARRHGEGLLILVHTSAGPGWSTLSLSGLFEAMLRRFLPLALDAKSLDIAAAEPWRLERRLDGRGELATPAEPVEIANEDWERARVGPQTPPGIYRSGDARRALNIADTLGPRFRFQPLETDGLRAAAETAPPVDLGRWLLLAALLLFAADMIVALRLRGALGVAPRAATAAGALLAVLSFLPQPANAQSTDGPVLGYIGGTPQDAMIQRGLEGLSMALRRRTSVDPAPVAEVSPGDADIGRYPLIYWPAAARPRMNADEAANMRDYLARGGLVLFDFGRPLGADSGARDLLLPLGLPPLEEAGRDHVLFKSYYILRRAGGGALWLEQNTGGESGRVSGVAIGGGDWARLWSGERAVSPSQRESAIRFGINLVMYALTGTYKADQVHTQTLLNRLGDRDQ